MLKRCKVIKIAEFCIENMDKMRRLCIGWREEKIERK